MLEEIIIRIKIRVSVRAKKVEKQFASSTLSQIRRRMVLSNLTSQISTLSARLLEILRGWHRDYMDFIFISLVILPKAAQLLDHIIIRSTRLTGVQTWRSDMSVTSAMWRQAKMARPLTVGKISSSHFLVNIVCSGEHV